MKRRVTILSIAGFLLLAGLLALGAGLYASKPVERAVAAPVASQSVPKLTTQALLTRVNAERAKVGVAPLTEDPRLDRSAQQKADDMEQNNYLGHVDKNGRHGYTIAIEDAPGICHYASENLAWNTDDSQLTVAQAVGWWLNSKPHREAMLDKRYNYTGFGITNNIAVEHFC